MENEKIVKDQEVISTCERYHAGDIFKVMFGISFLILIGFGIGDIVYNQSPTPTANTDTLPYTDYPPAISNNPSLITYANKTINYNGIYYQDDGLNNTDAFSGYTMEIFPNKFEYKIQNVTIDYATLKEHMANRESTLDGKLYNLVIENSIITDIPQGVPVILTFSGINYVLGQYVNNGQVIGNIFKYKN